MSSNQCRELDSTSQEVWIAVVLVVVALGMLYAYNLRGWLINDDEGAFLYQTWRISQGELPYRDLFSSRWPLFLYTGAGWMELAGVSVTSVRLLSVGMTLGTALLVFSLARQMLSVKAALLSMVVFLLHPHVFRFGRSFQPESFYVFFSVLGLYFFNQAYMRKNTVFFCISGSVFAIATVYKLLSALVLGGCILFLAFAWFKEYNPRPRLFYWGLALLVPYVLLFGSGATLFILKMPRFYESVVKLNLIQGQERTWLQVFLKGLVFLIAYFLNSAPFLLLAGPAALHSWSEDLKTTVLSWQLPTALAFTALSRELFPRLLYYLIPSLSILFSASLEPIRRLQRRHLLFWAITVSVLIPWAMDDAQMLVRSEQNTMKIARYIQRRVARGEQVLSDYQEFNFYARRPSTYSGSEISYVVVAAGQVTGDGLIAELDKQEVKMVIMDVSPTTAHHLVSLRDYEKFQSYLEMNFALVDRFSRGEQQLDVYLRP